MICATRSSLYPFSLVLGVLITFQTLFLKNERVFLFLIPIFIIYCSSLVQFNPFHPVVWLIPFLFFYHFAIVILGILHIAPVSNPSEIILIGWITILTSVLTLLVFCKPYNYNTERYSKNKIKVLKLPTTLLHYTLIFLAIWDNLRFLKLGVTSKAELNVRGLRSFLFIYSFIMVTYSVLIVKSVFVKRRFPFWLFFITGLTCLISTLNLGERDIFLRFCMVTIFLVVASYNIPKKYIFLLAVFILFLIPVLGGFKNVFVKDVRDSKVISESLNQPLIGLLNGEFLSAGRNIDTLLRNKHQWEYFYGVTILWDTWRSFVPGIILSCQNSVTWFAGKFHADLLARGQGVGFSLAGEGLINFGYFGVGLFYFALAFSLSFLYNKGQESLAGLVIYVLAAPFFIYVIRGDFSHLFSPIIKQILAPFFILMITSSLLKIAVAPKKEHNASLHQSGK